MVCESCRLYRRSQCDLRLRIAELDRERSEVDSSWVRQRSILPGAGAIGPGRANPAYGSPGLRPDPVCQPLQLLPEFRNSDSGDRDSKKAAPSPERPIDSYLQTILKR